MYRFFAFTFIVCPLLAASQTLSIIKDGEWKTNKANFNAGDTIAVTIYNRYNFPMVYRGRADSCYFKSKRMFPLCPDPPSVTKLDPGDSLTITYIFPESGTYEFNFYMMRRKEKGKVHHLPLKWSVGAGKKGVKLLPTKDK